MKGARLFLELCRLAIDQLGGADCDCTSRPRQLPKRQQAKVPSRRIRFPGLSAWDTIRGHIARRHKRFAACPKQRPTRVSRDLLRTATGTANGHQSPSFASEFLRGPIHSKAATNPRFCQSLSAALPDHYLSDAGLYNLVEATRGLPDSLPVKYFEKRGTDWQLQQSICSRPRLKTRRKSHAELLQRARLTTRRAISWPLRLASRRSNESSPS